MESAAVGAILNVLFDRMAPREFTNFFRGRKDEERLLKNLKHKLRAVRPLLNDAEEKQWTNRTIKDWVDELKDVILHADDLLDEIATKAMQSKLDSEFPSSSSTKRKLRDLNRSFVGTDLRELIPRSFVGVPDMESRIEEIVERLEDFLNEKDSLGLRDVVVASHRLSPTTSLVEHASVFGRNNDKDKIIQLLISDAGPQIGVIPIVGMGGIGKTTLAQLVYNDPKVDHHFELKVWVCVSEVFDIRRVTISILDELKLPSSSNNLNTLQVELRNCLAKKKFLIVLDDVWNEKYENWEQLRRPFADGERGSKIIVTARNKGVASIMQTVPIFHLEQLSNEDCWLLFSKHAFVNVSHNVQSSLEPIGRKIVEKCKGLPLAAKTLGGLLRYKVEVEEWENVLQSHFWDLQKNKSDILPALLLSYHHLPSHLKLCFAFCAIIPKGWKFEKDELVPLWIAEGFVQQPRTGGRIEEIGDGYFRELISRSLFQQSSDNYFSMHDLINDLAKFVAGEYCLRLEDDHPHDISKVRYLSFIEKGFGAVAKSKTTNEDDHPHDISKVRIFKRWAYLDSPLFTMYGLPNALNSVLSRLSCLRALSLRGFDFVELPDSIGDLIHLRHLDLSRAENIKSLPDTIGKLIHLRHLDLSRAKKIESLPDTICRLCNLETLLLRDCTSLSTLPELLCKLICLRHLDLRGTKLRDMPMQIGKLRSLQQLTNFVVGSQNGSTISELRELDYLELNLEWVAESQMEMALEKLQPHVNLKHLTIIEYSGTRFPAWLGYCSFSKLKSLYLCTRTNCFELPPLGKLPSLQELTIEGMNMENVGSEFYVYDSSGIKPFQSLEKLMFKEMPQLKCEFLVHFPCLKKLEINNISELECLPLESKNLKELVISRCPMLHTVQILPLEELKIFDCPMLNTIQIRGGDHQSFSSQSEEEMKRVNPKFRSLVIGNCPKLELPRAEETQHYYKFLQDLKIREGSCDSLISVPLGFFPKLHSLEIDRCKNFESFSFIEGIQISTLTAIRIDSCKKLKALPKHMSTLLPSLRSLHLIDLPGLVWLQDLAELVLIEHQYKFLQNLSIVGSCDSLKKFPLSFFPNLRSLEINNCKSLESLSGLDRQQNLTSLQMCTSIKIRSCERLKALPEQMCTLLSSLEELGLVDLPKIASLPDEGLPSSLSELHIWNCPWLERRCQKETGEDWRKISHIPNIFMHQW